MHQTQLHLNLREHRLDRLRESFQSIHANDEDVGHSTILQLRQHLQPELRSFRLARPQTQYFFVALHVHANRHVNRLVADMASLANLHYQSVQIYDRVHRVQRPVLPTLDLLHHLFGDVGNQLWTHLDFIDLLQVPLNLARAHAPRVHRYDLVVETGEARLPLTDNLRFVAAVAITRRLQRYLPKIPLQRLGGRAIARVAAVVACRVMLLIAQVVGHLGLHGPLQQRFGQLLQQTVFAYDVFWLLIVRQQLVDEFEVDSHRVSLV